MENCAMQIPSSHMTVSHKQFVSTPLLHVLVKIAYQKCVILGGGNAFKKIMYLENVTLKC